MDYSWLEVIKKSLDSIDGLADKLRLASTGKAIEDSELRMLIGEIEDITSRVSRLLSQEKNREVLSKYHITSHELYVLIPHVDDEIRKPLLSGDRKVFATFAKKLSESTSLWRERIIKPFEREIPNIPQAEIQPHLNKELPLENRLLLLLGAGASKPLGIPTMTDFWQIILANSKTDDEQIAINMLLKAAKDETTHLPPDLEKLLGMLDRYQDYFRILWGDPRFGLLNFSLEYNLPYQRMFPWNHEQQIEKALRHLDRTSIGISRVRETVIRIMDAVYTKQLERDAVL